MDGSLYTFAPYIEPLSEALHIPVSQVTWINSCQFGISLLAGPIISVVVNRFGFRKTAICGALINIAGITSASFCTNFFIIILLYSIVGGIGYGLVYSPAIIIVGHYFEKYRAISMGIAVCGSSVGILCLSMTFRYFVPRYGWERSFQLQAGLMVFGLLCTFVYRPINTVRLHMEEGPDDNTTKLDDYADAVSETSSTIEFQSIFGRNAQVVDLHSISNDRISRKTNAVSLKNYKNRKSDKNIPNIFIMESKYFLLKGFIICRQLRKKMRIEINVLSVFAVVAVTEKIHLNRMHLYQES